MKENIQTLDADSRSAVALVFMRGGILPSPVTLSPEEEDAINLLGGTTSGVRHALTALDGSFVLLVQQGGNYSWRLKHPTIRDAFAALIAENRELMDIYLVGTPIRQLFQEISCGDVGLEGLKVIVPTDRYDLLLLRIETFLAETRESKDPVNRFLSSRCDRDFLAGFISRNPGFVSALHVGAYLRLISDVALIVRLHQLDLLPEVERLRHVAAIRDLAVDTPDSGFLREDIRSLFTSTELDDILSEVRTQLLPNLPKCIDEWQSSHDGEEDPDSYFDWLKSALTDYQEALSTDIEAVEFINSGLAKIQDAIEEIRSELPQEPDDEDFFRDSPRGGSSVDSRSIFDDVDL